MKIEEAEGGSYHFEEHHKVGKLKTCLPAELLEKLGHEIDDSTNYVAIQRIVLDRCRNYRTGIMQMNSKGISGELAVNQ